MGVWGRNAAIDNSEIRRWQKIEAVQALAALADHAKEDVSYTPRLSSKSSRWHATAHGVDFELICTSEKFWDLRAERGGGGAIDLAMHLFGGTFKQAVKTLKDCNL